MAITLETVREDNETATYIQAANASLHALDYTEHGFRHANLVAQRAGDILHALGYPARTCELAAVAGYLHDMGNFIHRENHALSGSLLARQILSRLGMPSDECALIMNAIGNHEEERGYATTPVSAALIVADKSDVHRTRVQCEDESEFDIHDRVNYATTDSRVIVLPEERVIRLELTIDVGFAPVIDYFAIFLSRMTMVQQAAEYLNCRFQLVINGAVFS